MTRPRRRAGRRPRPARRSSDPAAEALLCPSCQSPVAAGERFCEACGADLGPPTGAVPPTRRTPRRAAQSAAPQAAAAACHECGGEVADDGYCTQCGAPGAKPAQPLHRAAGPLGGGRVRPRRAPHPQRGCRRPRRRARAGRPRGPGRLRRGLLVDRLRRRQPGGGPGRARRPGQRSRHRGHGHASPPGSRRARRPSWRRPTRPTTPSSPTPSRARATRHRARSSPPSSTAATSSWAGSATAGPTGCPTPRRPRLLTIDDSFAAEQIADGVPRADAESGPQAHAITRWLGIDAPDHTPRTVSLDLDGPGWVLVCSDGLWNYCSEAQDLADPAGRRTSRSAGAEPLAAGRGPRRLGQRPGRPGQHHGGPGPRRAPASRTPPPHHPAHRPRTAPQPAASPRGSPARWQHSQLTSTRTSSCPTAAPTSTPSSPSPAPGRARPGSPGRATPPRSSSSTPPAR